ncbi:MAG: hypothetical protein KIT84_23775 [Labilithrix sp.]|nr:hypothetical protein [Labilithrix sp.]
MACGDGDGDCTNTASCGRAGPSSSGSGAPRDVPSANGGVTDAETPEEPGVKVVFGADPVVVTQGKSAAVPVTIERLGGFTGSVVLQPFAANPKVHVPTITIPADQTAGAFTAEVAVDLPQGPLPPIAVTALTSGAALGEGSIRLFVRGPAGSLDTSFGGGVVVGTLPNTPFTHAVAQRDGKVIALAVTGTNAVRAVRFNTDGTVDATYGGGTGAVATFTDKADETRAALDGAGRLYVTGGGVARFTTEGALDPTWGNGGIAEAAIKRKSKTSFVDVAVESNGSVFVTERCGVECDTTSSLRLTHLTPSGAIDTTFFRDRTTPGTHVVREGSGSPSYSFGGAITLESGSVLVSYTVVDAAAPLTFSPLVTVVKWDGTTTSAHGRVLDPNEGRPATAVSAARSAFVAAEDMNVGLTRIRRYDPSTLATLPLSIGTAKPLGGIRPSLVLVSEKTLRVTTIHAPAYVRIHQMSDEGVDDTSFAPDGVVTHSLQTGADGAVIYGAFVQPDGSVIAVGGGRASGTDKRSRIARVWQ